MGNKFTTEKPLSIPPLVKFPYTFPQQLTHKLHKITNIKVLLNAKGQIFLQKYFSVKTNLIDCIKSYVDLCSLFFTQGDLKDQIITKTHYQKQISEFHVNGFLKLKIMERRFILQKSNDSEYFIQESIVASEQGLLFEDKYFISQKNSLREVKLQEDVDNFKKNITTLIEGHTKSQVRKIIHQSYQRSRAKQISKQPVKRQSKQKIKGELEVQEVSKIVGNMFESSGYSVSYKKQSTSLSLLSLLCISGGLQGNYFQGQVDVSKYNIKLSDIKDDQIKRIIFILELKEQLANQLKLTSQQIYVGSVNQNKAKVAYPYPSRSKLIIKQKRIIDHLEFSQDDFDRKGNRNYKLEKNIIQMRGGYPYYRPVGWLRFGLNISEYSANDGSDKWIQSNKDEWAIMYHGVKNPAKKIQQGLSTANAIAKFGLKIGSAHAHQKVAPLLTENTVRILKNKNVSIDKYLSQQIYTVTSVQNLQYQTKSFDNQLGEGIYGSPLLNQICVDQNYVGKFVIENTEYLLAFQCRVRPQSVYISSKQKRYWLVRDPQNVRPYGILITKRKYLQKESTIRSKEIISKSYNKFCKSNDIF